jgi:glycosyltransferase involved in cell wall biosynthesis
MNIVFLLPNLTGSGAEKNTMRLASLFKQNGYNVKIILLENIILHEVPNNLEIIALTKRKDTFKVFGRLGDKMYFKKLQPYLNDTDVLISSLPRADRVAKLYNGKKYFIIRMSYKEELKLFSTKRANKKLKIYREIYKGENLITVSKAMEKDLIDLDINFKSVRTIYNGFDFDDIRKRGLETVDLPTNNYIISPNAFRIQKRYDVLLDAMKYIHSDIKLVILANGGDELSKMIQDRDLEDRVIVLGFKKNPYPYIRNARLTVLSSDREGLPTVVIESLILGTPVVSTDCPTGPREILTGDLESYLVPTGNPKLLGEKIDFALNKNIVIHDKVLEPFSYKILFEKYIELFKEE